MIKSKIAAIATASVLGLNTSSCMFPAQTGIGLMDCDHYYEYFPCYPKHSYGHVADSIPAEDLLPAFKNKPGKFYKYCNYFSYPARIGDDVKYFYLKEECNPDDPREFQEFQQGMYRETKRKGDINCLEWQEDNLRVVKNGWIMVPDGNKNGIPGE